MINSQITVITHYDYNAVMCSHTDVKQLPQNALTEDKGLA